MQVSIYELSSKASEVEKNFLEGEYVFVSSRQRYGRGHVAEGISLQLKSDHVEVRIFVPTFDEATTRENVVHMAMSVQEVFQKAKELVPTFPGEINRLGARTSVNHDYSGGSVVLCTIGEGGEFGWNHPWLKKS